MKTRKFLLLLSYMVLGLIITIPTYSQKKDQSIGSKTEIENFFNEFKSVVKSKDSKKFLEFCNFPLLDIMCFNTCGINNINQNNLFEKNAKNEYNLWFIDELFKNKKSISILLKTKSPYKTDIQKLQKEIGTIGELSEDNERIIADHTPEILKNNELYVVRLDARSLSTLIFAKINNEFKLIAHMWQEVQSDDW